MKILIFAEVYYPYVMGGGEFSTKQMTEGLVKKGHEAVVYCLGKTTCEEVIGGVVVKREYIRGLSEYFIGAATNNQGKSHFTSFDKILRKWPDLYLSSKWYKKYKAIITKEAPDLVHTASPMSYLGRFNLWKAAHDLNIPVSHVCRSPTLLKLNFFGGWFNHYNIKRNSKASSFLTALASPSKFMLERHTSVGIKGKNFNDVIYNSVDFKKITPSLNFIKQKENMILYAGTLNKDKGIPTLIKAMEGLEGVRLLLIGRGELAGQIEKNPKVELIDWMEREALYDYMKKAKAVILPSEWDEAFGRILIEAIYNGTLGIGSTRGGIPEVLGFDENYIFTAGDVQGLRQCIEMVIGMSPSDYKAAIDRQQKMTAGFANDKYVENWERFFLQQLKTESTDAEWCRYKSENMGIRECAQKLLNAIKRRIWKKFYGMAREFCVRIKKTDFHSSYDKGKENIVVSLTSTVARIKHIFPTLYSLAGQTHKPDLIVLWLSKDEKFPLRVIAKIKRMGIKVEFKEDLGPNTKYHYAFGEYKNDLIITVDDDIIYHKEMIQELYSTFLKHPNLVIARRVHKIRFDADRQPVKYRDWIWEYRDSKSPAHELFATGVGGVLYPPSVTNLKCWKNTDFLKVCPSCDDIWLKFCEFSQGIKVCAVENSRLCYDVVIARTQKNALAAENVGKEKNDEHIKSCMQYFGMSKGYGN